ncbi:hypothetical protein NPIL_575911 [Nephila pilipes]|uniref:Uncharacterized protein n=1 Tax=Nephila pilipes TaxID=299642 RepID=A0A8X6P6Y6_NEPPI|nr:hypothetical protein NPIL_575911 [Nephila pilipes]
MKPRRCIVLETGQCVFVTRMDKLRNLHGLGVTYSHTSTYSSSLFFGFSVKRVLPAKSDPVLRGDGPNSPLCYRGWLRARAGSDRGPLDLRSNTLTLPKLRISAETTVYCSFFRKGVFLHPPDGIRTQVSAGRGSPAYYRGWTLLPKPIEGLLRSPDEDQFRSPTCGRVGYSPLLHEDELPCRPGSNHGPLDLRLLALLGVFQHRRRLLAIY